MKHRVASLMLVFVSAIVAVSCAMSPQQASAAESYGINIGGNYITSDHLSDIGWRFDPESYTLTLTYYSSGAGLTSVMVDGDGNPTGTISANIRVDEGKDLTINLATDANVGERAWKDSASAGIDGFYGIYAPGSNITITGNHQLNIWSNKNAIYCKTLSINGGAKVDCKAYNTAVLVGNDHVGKFAHERGDYRLDVKGDSALTAETTHGQGITWTFKSSALGEMNFVSVNAAAIFVNGPITVEDSTLAGKLSWKELIAEHRLGTMGIFSSSTCTIIGENARVSGVATDDRTDHDYDRTIYGTVAAHFVLSGGATLEGDVPNGVEGKGVALIAIAAAGNRHYIYNPNIEFQGPGTVIASKQYIYNTDAKSQAGSITSTPPWDFTSTEVHEAGGKSTLTLTCSQKSDSICVRDINGEKQWSYYESFRDAHSLESSTLEFGELVADEIQKGVWDSSGEDPKLHIISGDWTVHQAEGSLVKYRVKSGNLTVEAQDGKTYRGGMVNLANESTLTIQGDGIWNLYWGINPYAGEWQCGTVRFMNGTVFNASAPAAKRVEIHGGNINYDVRNSQAIYGSDGSRVFKSTYDTSACAADTLTDININQVIDAVQSSRSVDIGSGSGFYLIDKKFCLWMNHAEFLGSVRFQPSDDTPYVADVTEVEAESYNLTPPIRLADFTVNGYRSFYETVGDSITLTAGTLTNEQRMDGKRVEWSYTDPHEASGESHAIDCNELSYTIDELTENDDLRAYTCKVYQINGDEERELGAYTATIHTMKWQSSNTEIPGAIGTSVTLEANAVEGSDNNWIEGFDSIWEIDKNDGQGWQRIAGATDESYVLSVESQDVQNWKFRRHLSSWVIGNLSVGAITQYFDLYSPEITVTLNPVIAQQPQDMTVQANDPATHSFTVQVANATSSTTYQWQRKAGSDFLPISSNDLPVSGEDSATLTFTSMRSDLAGQYRCAVSNETVVTCTNAASLHVKQPPAVASIAQSVAANAGGRAVVAATLDEGIVVKNVNLIWQYSTDGGNNWTNVTSTNAADSIRIENQMREFVDITIKRWDSSIGQYVYETVSRDDEYLSSSLVINKAMSYMDGLRARCVLSDVFGEYPSSSATLTVGEDETAPTGAIGIGANSWSSFQDVPTFAALYNADQVVSITASDDDSGVAQIAYCESEIALTLESVAALPDDRWTVVAEGATTASATVIAANAKRFVCYVRIRDAAGNMAYLSTDGGVFDTVAPVVDGVENEARYFAERHVSVIDAHLRAVTLDGVAVGDSFTLPGGEDADHTIVATDAAGNSTTVVVRMRTPASQPEGALLLDDLTSSAAEGYSQSAAQSIAITNTGDADVLVVSVEVDNSNFIVRAGDGTIEGGCVNDSWVVQLVEGLSAGTYTGRVTVTCENGICAHAMITMRVTAPRLTLAAPVFAKVQEGYSQPEARALVIANEGDGEARISRVHVPDSRSFTIEGGGAAIAPGDVASSWAVRPVAGLPAGAYGGTVTVEYANGKIAEVPVSFTVERSPQSAPVAPGGAESAEGERPGHEGGTGGAGSDEGSAGLGGGANAPGSLAGGGVAEADLDDGGDVVSSGAAEGADNADAAGDVDGAEDADDAENADAAGESDPDGAVVSLSETRGLPAAPASSNGDVEDGSASGKLVSMVLGALALIVGAALVVPECILRRRGAGR